MSVIASSVPPIHPGEGQSAAGPALKRVIGPVVLAATIVNITVGGGIFRLPSSVALALGAAAPIAYVACAVAIGLIAICIADAGSRVSQTGGPYAYIEVAFGPFIGFLSGVLLWLLGTFAFAAVSVIFVGNVGELLPVLRTSAGQFVFLALLFAGLAAVNIRGVQQGARLATVATVAKLAPLIFLAVVGAFFIRPENLSITSVPPASDIARTSILLIFAFSGLETALVPSGEVRDTARTVPRAILLAMVTITVLYLALQTLAQGVLGPALARETPAPLADAAGVALGGPGRTLLLVGASISMFGYVSGMILALPRALFAFARDGILPARLAAIHPRFATPAVAIVVQTVLVLALAARNPFERLAIMSNLSVLVLYALCCAAAWQLRRRDVRAEGEPYRMPLGSILPWLGIVLIGWFLTSIRLQEWLALFAALAGAALLYVVARRRRGSALRAAAVAPTEGTS
jgi:basic amino acid/polyamine antiporter, APA family